jgi:hypothetical protein
LHEPIFGTLKARHSHGSFPSSTRASNKDAVVLCNVPKNLIRIGIIE